MLSKATVKARPSVLWCYKKDLFLSSHRKKRANQARRAPPAAVCLAPPLLRSRSHAAAQVKKLVSRGLLDPEKEDPFSLFVASTAIRYCYYKETQSILGQTFGMLVLQDFEALTPNLLARTVETVEGGGVVVLLLSKLDSLQQLYTLSMDVHARFRTESHTQVTGRFNERFILSLAASPACLFVDDELNVLPLSSSSRSLAPLPADAAADPDGFGGSELRELRASLADTLPAGPLLAKCRSADQAKAVVTFLDAISEKALRSTVALTAGRGRGKSAALGLAVAGALACGYANIFVTSPSPENLRTLFEFVFKGLDGLGYKEHLDYDLVESTNPAFMKAVVRVNVFRTHRQTVQYVSPQHAERIAQAELLIIDEAAAIPLPTVKALMGPYLVFLCSTVNGYEGTGRSLSLKLIAQLRDAGARSAALSAAAAASSGGGGGSGGGRATVSTATGRLFKEVVLTEPIRYAAGDKVEAWLNGLLCLDAAEHLPRLGAARLPHPSECELYCVNRDTLFSGHRHAESFLQRLMALYAASHYRNTPNDLQMLADAPAHRLFVLLPPQDEAANALPDVLCLIQVALEGAIGRKSAAAQLARGEAPQGDLIPWTLAQQFQDDGFPGLTGARIVRIAVHPELPRLGYGSRAVALLSSFYSGEMGGLLGGESGAAVSGDGVPTLVPEEGATPEPHGGGLLTEAARPRRDLPPLLTGAAERVAERCDWVGAAFGLTQELLNFWNRAGFSPVYLRQTPSDTTGECSAIMLKPLGSGGAAGGAAGGGAAGGGGGGAKQHAGWVAPFCADFRVRYTSLLGGAFRSHHPALALTLLAPRLAFTDDETSKGAPPSCVPLANCAPLSPHDMARLRSFTSGAADPHLIRDLIPPLARAFFGGRLPASLSHAQAAILAVIGLQQRDPDDAGSALGLPASQIAALFNKAMRRLHACLATAEEARARSELPSALRLGGEAAMGPKETALRPHPVALDDDLAAAAADVGRAARAAALLDALDANRCGTTQFYFIFCINGWLLTSLFRYAIKGSESDWDAALGGSKQPRTSGFLSVKRRPEEGGGDGGRGRGGGGGGGGGRGRDGDGGGRGGGRGGGGGGGRGEEQRIKKKKRDA